MRYLKECFAVLTVLAVASVGSAATVGTFEVDFLGVEYNGDGTSTWTYKVSSDDDNQTGALSHWTLELCPDATVVSPTTSYTTIASYNGATGRADITYEVEIGNDPTLGIYGIKFQDAKDANGDEANLGEDGVMEMDIFQFTLDKHYAVSDGITVMHNDVGVKNQDTAVGVIQGPAIDCTTHVVPVPAAAWMGLSLLGGIGLSRKIRRGNA